MAASNSAKKGKLHIDDKVKNKKYNHSFVKDIVGKDFNFLYIQEHGLSQPFLVKDTSGLYFRLPDSTFGIANIEQCLGPSCQVEVTDGMNAGQHCWSLKDWMTYYDNTDRGSCLMMMSVEFSRTKLEKCIELPEIVRQLDWLYQVWPVNLMSNHHNEGTSTYPQIQKFCTVTAAGSLRDFHIDIGGSTVWHSVLRGQKIFWLIPPTKENYELYEESSLARNKDVFFADEVKSCQRIVIEPGNLLFIPAGWIYAVYSPVDSVSFCGNFLHSFAVSDQLSVYKLEQRLKLHGGFPFFIEMQWYVLDRYVATLSTPASRSRTAADHGPLRKHVGRQKLKTDDEAGGDCRNRKTCHEDEVADDTEENNEHSDSKRNSEKRETVSDGTAKKRSSPRSDKRVQPAASASKTTSLLKHSQRSVLTGTSSSPGTGHSVRAKVIDLQATDSEAKNEDVSADAEAELDRSMHWIHITHREHHSLKELVEFLESLDISNRHVPSEVQSADELLASAKVMLESHAHDDQKLALTGIPVLPIREQCFAESKVTENSIEHSGSEAILEFSPSAASDLLSKPDDISPAAVSSVSASSGFSVSSSVRRRRVRCRKCEACTRTECGECPFCKDMKKFGGLGRMKQTCVARQCIAPMLPTAAVCVLCNKGDTDADLAVETVMQTVDPQWQLMECNVCWNIVHPSCLRETYPQLTHDGIINDDLPNSWECPKCCDAGAPKNMKPRAMKGTSYVTKQCNGDTASSTDEEELQVVDSDVDVLDEREDNKSVNSPQSPKMKAASNTVKKKREVSRQSKVAADRSANRRLKEMEQSSEDKQPTVANCWNEPATNIILPDMSLVHKYVVRPSPIPHPPRYVQMTSGSNHPLEHNLWVRVFTLLDPADLVRCMRVCKTWNRWGYDRRLWTSIDLSRCRLRQTHLIGIVRRQPKSLDLSWTNVSHRQLAWLVERLPHLRQLRLAGNSWPAVSSLCGCRCPLLTLLDIAWVAVIYDGCVRDLLSPPQDYRPGLDVSQSRLRRCTELVLAGSDITNDALESVAQHLLTLERLDLSYCVGIDDDGVRLLSEAAASQTLTTIHLTGCVCLTSSCFVYLARFPQLRQVTVEGCLEITEKDCLDFMTLHPECKVSWKEHYRRVE